MAAISIAVSEERTMMHGLDLVACLVLVS